MERSVAVFDVDGTIFRGNLLEVLVDQLVTQGVFSASALEEARQAQVAWWKKRDRQTYNEYMNLMIATLIENIRGVEEVQIQKAADLIAMRAQRSLYRYTGGLIESIKDTHSLVAITGAVIDVVSPIVKSLGFEAIHGSTFEVKNGVYTGKAEAGYKNKDVTLKRLVEELGLTFKGSIGVGDTDSDIPMMELVEKPIAFNPNKELFGHAHAKGWEVVLERKDMIFHIQRGGRFELDEQSFGHFHSD